MKISISEADGQLAELVRRAEAGDDVVLTRDGRSAVRLVAVRKKPTAEEKRALIEALQAQAKKTALPGPSAARSQDFLYDDDGLPR